MVFGKNNFSYNGDNNKVTNNNNYNGNNNKKKNYSNNKDNKIFHDNEDKSYA